MADWTSTMSTSTIGDRSQPLARPVRDVACSKQVMGRVKTRSEPRFRVESLRFANTPISANHVHQ
jgi:hypothetical protein